MHVCFPVSPPSNRFINPQWDFQLPMQPCTTGTHAHMHTCTHEVYVCSTIGPRRSRQRQVIPSSTTLAAVIPSNAEDEHRFLLRYEGLSSSRWGKQYARFLTVHGKNTKQPHRHRPRLRNANVQYDDRGGVATRRRKHVLLPFDKGDASKVTPKTLLLRFRPDKAARYVTNHTFAQLQCVINEGLGCRKGGETYVAMAAHFLFPSQSIENLRTMRSEMKWI
jgi:hypothetical protein